MVNEESEWEQPFLIPTLDELPEVLPITEDGVFQAALTQEETLAGLRDMAECFGDIKADSVELLPSEPNAPDKGAKRIIYDIRFIARVKNERFNFEMQASHMRGDNLENGHSNLNARIIYNLSRRQGRRFKQWIQH